MKIEDLREEKNKKHLAFNIYYLTSDLGFLLFEQTTTYLKLTYKLSSN